MKHWFTGIGGFIIGTLIWTTGAVQEVMDYAQIEMPKLVFHHQIKDIKVNQNEIKILVLRQELRAINGRIAIIATSNTEHKNILLEEEHRKLNEIHREIGRVENKIEKLK